ncbi:Phorbol esters/diacylglycerol binding domain protein [Trichostrongylus colubriformis]|uniref:Phorbol esters/diacylglycerol binding domain protein n=1 Tax=Trichostrongylus colubriformis TaxID=6319 RepID=A0AAN8IS37_TRICO
MLFGLLKQGLQCSSCKMNVHKRCKWNVAKDCGINIDDVPAVSAYLDVASGVPNVSVRFIEEVISREQLFVPFVGSLFQNG